MNSIAQRVFFVCWILLIGVHHERKICCFMVVFISTKFFETRFSGSGNCLANSSCTNAALLSQLPKLFSPTLCWSLLVIWNNHLLLSLGGSFLTGLFKFDSELKSPKHWYWVRTLTQVDMTCANFINARESCDLMNCWVWFFFSCAFTVMCRLPKFLTSVCQAMKYIYFPSANSWIDAFAFYLTWVFRSFILMLSSTSPLSTVARKRLVNSGHSEVSPSNSGSFSLDSLMYSSFPITGMLTLVVGWKLGFWL